MQCYWLELLAVVRLCCDLVQMNVLKTWKKQVRIGIRFYSVVTMDDLDEFSSVDFDDKMLTGLGGMFWVILLLVLWQDIGACALELAFG